MTRIFITSTYYSDIQHAFKRELLDNSTEVKVCQDLTELNAEMARKHFLDEDELSWKPFSPDSTYLNQARKTLLQAGEDELIAWGDSGCSLLLNFWHKTAKGTKFILFYTSPEDELTKYINSQPFSLGMARHVISAWCIRTRAMLDFCLNHRNICLLVNLRYLESNSVELYQLIEERFSIELAFNPHKDELPDESSTLLDFLATTLLLNNQAVSEIYDEVRSAATIIDEQDKAIADIQVRNNSLITEFLSAANSHTQLIQTQKEMEDKLALSQLQINQLVEELEHYFTLSEEQASQNKAMADYLGSDPLLRITRQLRESE